MSFISDKKSIKTIFLGFLIALCVFLSVLFSLLFSLGEKPVLAAPFTKLNRMVQERSASSEVAGNLASGVDRFLTSMPLGYFTIANVAELKTQVKSASALLVDVREPAEYQSGHIPNAVNIPLRTLAQNSTEIPRDRPVVLYCSTGYRSAMGVMTLHLLGYENVQGFPPSFAAWKASGESIASN